MEHLILRCKHCKREYTYCTYGNGPQYGTESGCTREYCAECANAIQNALKNIPIRYEGRPIIITDKDEQERLCKIFDEIHNEYEANTKIKASRLIGDWGYEKMENFYFNKIQYYRCFRENGTIDVYVFDEYDLIEQKFTGKHYFDNTSPMRSYCSLTQLRIPILDIKEQTIDAPTNKLFFNDLEWEVIPNKKSELK